MQILNIKLRMQLYLQLAGIGLCRTEHMFFEEESIIIAMRQ